MFEDSIEFREAIVDLELRLKNQYSDRKQINKILFSILQYPNIQKACDHHRANNLGSQDLFIVQKNMEDQINQNEILNLEVCNCCGLKIQNEPIPYLTKMKDIQLGIGVQLFFTNYLFNAFVFLLMFLIYSIYALYTNLQAYRSNIGSQTDLLCLLDDSEANGCGFSVIGAGSKVIKQNEEKRQMSRIQAIIGIGFVALWGLLNIIRTHWEEKHTVEMDFKRISASNFTLMFKGVKKQYLDGSYQDSLQWFRKIFKEYGVIVGNDENMFKVQKINICRPLYADNLMNQKNHKQAQKNLHQEQSIFREWIRHRKTSVEFSIPEEQRREAYQNYEKYQKQHIETHINRQIELEDDNNTVFVTLTSSKNREEVEKRNKPASWKNFWHLCSKPDFPLEGVVIERAPESQQIRWMNVGFPRKSKIIRKILLWVLTWLLIGCSLGISVGIAHVNQQKLSQYVSIGISLVVTVVNIGIQMVIKITSSFENEFISSVDQSNVAFKIGIGQIVNSIGVPIVVTLLVNTNSKLDDKAWLRAGGLVDDVFWIAVFNVAVPFARLLDPWERFLRIQRWWYGKPYNRLEIYTQKEFNKLFGNYEFDIGYQYAYLIKTSIFTAFFVTMQPVIAAFAPIGLFLYYLIDKRNLLRHFQRPTYHSPNINKTVDFLLLFSPLAFGFGGLLVNFFIKNSELEGKDNGTAIFYWIIVAIAGGFLLIVPLRIFYCCCVKRPEVADLNFDDKRALLKNDYDRLNPVTKEEALKQFERYLESLKKDEILLNNSNIIKMSSMMLKKKDKDTKSFIGLQSRFKMPLKDYKKSILASSADNLLKSKNSSRGAM